MKKFLLITSMIVFCLLSNQTTFADYSNIQQGSYTTQELPSEH